MMRTSDKCIVFSQWTSFLNIIQLALKAERISFVRLDGSMNAQNRKKAMDAFRLSPVRVVFSLAFVSRLFYTFLRQHVH